MSSIIHGTKLLLHSEGQINQTNEQTQAHTYTLTLPLIFEYISGVHPDSFTRGNTLLSFIFNFFQKKRNCIQWRDKLLLRSTTAHDFVLLILRILVVFPSLRQTKRRRNSHHGDSHCFDLSDKYNCKQFC